GCSAKRSSRRWGDWHRGRADLDVRNECVTLWRSVFISPQYIMQTSIRSILPTFCLLALALAACSGEPALQSLIVDNPFHGLEQETGRYELVVEELVQFGVEEEPVEQILSRPAAVVEGLGGRVYILDGTRIMMFEPDGSFVGSF